MAMATAVPACGWDSKSWKHYRKWVRIMKRWLRAETLDRSKEEMKAAGVKRRNSAPGRYGLLPMRKALDDPSFDPVATELARNILSASTNLVNIDYGSHSSIGDDSYRSYCRVLPFGLFSTEGETARTPHVSRCRGAFRL